MALLYNCQSLVTKNMKPKLMSLVDQHFYMNADAKNMKPKLMGPVGQHCYMTADHSSLRI